MDCEPEELQFLGIDGIYCETAKLILSWRRLFTQIAASLIVPLSALFLAQTLISHILLSQIHRTQDAIFSEWAFYLLFKSIYLLALLVFSLLSTSAIVYTVASVYSAKHDLLLSYRKVLSVVPKVWRRLAFTFLYAFLTLLYYNIMSFLFFAFAIHTALLFNARNLAITISIVYALVYLVGLVWISVVWHVASVVSVLEEECGKEAMQRSWELVRGEIGIAATVFVIMHIAFVGIEESFRRVVAAGHAPLPLKLGFAAAMLGLMSAVVLVALVAQTVVYFVCKSHHHESIDKLVLAVHLEVYLEEHTPLSAEDLQVEQIQV